MTQIVSVGTPNRASCEPSIVLACTTVQVGCTVKIFEERGFLSEDCPYGTDKQTLEHFAFSVLVDTYKNVPCHNGWHGFSVLQCAYAIMHPENNQDMQVFEGKELFALLIATLCHDAGHNGWCVHPRCI
eukprot:SAG31_NODE_6762_length_1895_cov_1.335746_2_plen_129_part_00